MSIFTPIIKFIVKHKIKSTEKIEPIRRLIRDSNSANDINMALLVKIIKDNQRTEFGRKYRFSEIKNAQDFRAMVPVFEAEEYIPLIKRMTNGGKNILTKHKIHWYSETTGTISGIPKIIPCSDQMLEIWHEMGAALFYEVSAKHDGSPYSDSNEILFNLIEITPFRQTKDKTRIGAISSRFFIPILNFVNFILTSPKELLAPPEPLDLRYVKLLFALPKKNVSTLCSSYVTPLVDIFRFLEENWLDIVNDIKHGTINSAVKLPPSYRKSLEMRMSPNPDRAQELHEIFTQGFDTPIAPRIWPNLKLLYSDTTGNFKIYLNILRRYIGNLDFFNPGFAASEAHIGIPIEINSDEYVFNPHSCFFEFIEVGHASEQHNATKTLLMSELKQNGKYIIVLTNASGLYRYNLGDVVLITGFLNQLPKFKFLYRQGQLISLADEKLTENIVSHAVENMATMINHKLNGYYIYPNIETSPGHYDLFVEFQNYETNNNQPQQLDEIFLECLKKADPHNIESWIKSNKMLPPKVFILKPRTMRKLYLERQEAHNYNSQLKIVHLVLNEELRQKLIANTINS